jgi:phytoene dehydrogenase-like protein
LEERDRWERHDKEDYNAASIASWLAALQHTVAHLFASRPEEFDLELQDLLLEFREKDVTKDVTEAHPSGDDDVIVTPEEYFRREREKLTEDEREKGRRLASAAAAMAWGGRLGVQIPVK